jgi:hypothetical protein
MLAGTLTASVGAAGQNRHQDVGLVQRLLLDQGCSPGPIDGRCGRHTVGAILRFQRGFLQHPDGRVDVDGTTWRHLRATRPVPGATPQRAAMVQSMAPAPTQAAAPRAAAPPQTATPAQAAPPLPPGTSPDYRHPLPLPPRDSINKGLISPSNAMMLQKFGEPRDNYSQDDQPVTNPRIKAALVPITIGPNTVHGIRPAVAVLRQVMAAIQSEQPELFPHLGSAGMLVCRYVRGSSRSISNHSWGTAVDITIDGKAEPFGERDVYLGLSLIGPIFNRYGWYWGAGYKRATDCHHFECGGGLIANFSL